MNEPMMQERGPRHLEVVFRGDGSSTDHFMPGYLIARCRGSVVTGMDLDDPVSWDARRIKAVPDNETAGGATMEFDALLLLWWDESGTDLIVLDRPHEQWEALYADAVSDEFSALVKRWVARVRPAPCRV